MQNESRWLRSARNKEEARDSSGRTGYPRLLTSLLALSLLGQVCLATAQAQAPNPASAPAANAVLAIFSDRPMSNEFWPILVTALREELASGAPETRVLPGRTVGRRRQLRSGGSNPPRRQDRSRSQRRESHHDLPSWGLRSRPFVFVVSWSALDRRGVGMGSPQPWANRALYSRGMLRSRTDAGYPGPRPGPRSTERADGGCHCAGDPTRVDSYRNTKPRPRARRARQSRVSSGRP